MTQGTGRDSSPTERSADVPTRHVALSRLPGRVIRLTYDAVSGVAPGLRPRLQRWLIGSGYSLMSTAMRDGGDDMTFLNFGYAALGDDVETLTLRPADSTDRYSIALYQRVVGSCNLRDADVLEVGCGRGGGASYMARYLGPRSVTGVDIAPASVAFCRRRHHVDGLTFIEGSAEQLPLPTMCFDAVVNVESSHCYPSFDRFVNEVSRVLRPGGYFLFADVRSRDDIAPLRERLQQTFEATEEECITPNVFRALQLDSEHRETVIRHHSPALFRQAVRHLAAVEGTPTFEAFRRGDLQYVRFVLRKPQTPR
jgi:ubiquinone/menaquinone biosynthesis C-methylase UbiE